MVYLLVFHASHFCIVALCNCVPRSGFGHLFVRRIIGLGLPGFGPAFAATPGGSWSLVLVMVVLEAHEEFCTCHENGSILTQIHPPKTNINIDIPKMMVWKKGGWLLFFDNGLIFGIYMWKFLGGKKGWVVFFQTPSPSDRTLNATLKSFEVWTNSWCHHDP